MTRIHGGYTNAELDALLGGPRPSTDGKAAFLEEIDATPTLDPAAAAADVAASTPSEEQTVSLKTDAVSRKFSGKMNKFKRALAEKIPKVLTSAIKDKGPEWQLTEDDTELLSEACENCLDVLEVDFRITPISKTLTNPLWVLLLPVFVLLLIFLPKAATNAEQVREYLKKMNAKPTEATPDEQSAETPVVQ